MVHSVAPLARVTFKRNLESHVEYTFYEGVTGTLRKSFVRV
jgi:hypothetical protein